MRKPSLGDLVLDYLHIGLFAFKGITFVFLIMILHVGVGLPDEDGAYRVLETNGYSAISITGWRFFGCEGELFRTGFSAKSPNGQSVTGVVCKGIFKGHTIRFD